MSIENVGLGIVISGNESSYSVGSSVRIVCSTDLLVESVQWLNDSDSRQELARTMSMQQLVLSIESVSAYQDSTEYTCEVHVRVSADVTRIIQETVTIRSK